MDSATRQSVAPAVAVKYRRVLSVDFVVVIVAIPLHANQRCRLREMRIEHLRNVMSSIPKTDCRRSNPGN